MRVLAWLSRLEAGFIVLAWLFRLETGFMVLAWLSRLEAGPWTGVLPKGLPTCGGQTSRCGRFGTDPGMATCAKQTVCICP